MPKPKRVPVRLSCSPPREVELTTVPGLVLHWDRIELRWHITHHASGGLVAHAPNRRLALERLAILGPLSDWTRAGFEIINDTQHLVYPLLQRWRYVERGRSLRENAPDRLCQPLEKLGGGHAP